MSVETLARPSPSAAVGVASPVSRDVWRELLARDPHALVAQSPEWIDALCASGYEDVSRLYALPSGNRAILPLVRRAGAWPAGWAPQASMPHAWGMGGAICDAPLGAQDVAAIVGDVVAQRALVTSVRPNPLHARLWAEAAGSRGTRIPRLAHVLDLDGGAEHVWTTRFHKKTRNMIRKAERSGLEIECDTTGRLVGVFHDLLMLSVDRWAGQQREPAALARWRARRRDPRAKFERLAATLGDAMRVWVAWKDGEPAAASIVLLGRNASATRGAMNKRIAAPTNANYLLEWLAIQDACAAGCRHYHFGESGRSRSLAHYKENFGARGVPYAEYRFERVPYTRADLLARTAVKRTLGFEDV